jgi:hypothetical protein
MLLIIIIKKSFNQQMALATAVATAGHPLVQQGYGPFGEHYAYTTERFPRIDYNEECWMPLWWTPEEEEWAPEYFDAYADPMSQIKREECEFGGKAEECN